MTPQPHAKKLSTRLFAGFVALALGVLFLSVSAVLTATWSEYEGEAERRLAAQADQFATLLSRFPGSDPAEIFALVGSPDVRITLVDAVGNVTFDNQADISTLPNHANREEIIAARSIGKSAVLRRSETTGYDTLYAAVAVPGTADVLRLAETRTSLPFYLAQIALPLVGILLVALALSLLLSRLMARRITAPLVNIDVENPLSGETYDEITPLLEKIQAQKTELTEKNAALEDTIVMRREFTGNVSHEMKSPLQVISGYAELISQGVAKYEDAKRFAGQIVNESAKMRTLIDDVLTLSKLDEQQFGEPVRLDLVEVCQSAIARLETAAQERGITVNLQGSSPTYIMGSLTMAEQLAYNLVDNAIRYGSEGGRVEVVVSSSEETVLLTVSDDGPGIPEELRERVFERFYRVDASRSRDAGGTGLGLAIVKHAAVSMGGHTWMEQSDLGGLKACAEFPAIL